MSVLKGRGRTSPVRAAEFTSPPIRETYTRLLKLFNRVEFEESGRQHKLAASKLSGKKK